MEEPIIVVGGGHAGVEAALVAARMGCPTVLVTHAIDSIACMPCNPSIGGLAKSHLVFELDALGGEMAKTTDLAGIQFRILNASRGPAVLANRTQCDKRTYARQMQKIVQSTPNLTLIQDEVIDLWWEDNHIAENGHLRGAKLAKRGKLAGSAVILTVGTALSGRIHIGNNESYASSGDGRAAADRLTAGIRKAGFSLKRLKTGTPPRLDGTTIDWNKCARQPGDEPPPFFSWAARNGLLFHVEQSEGNEHPLHATTPDCSTWNNRLPWHPNDAQIPCWLTQTNATTKQIIHDALPSSALYGGSITGTGVRYCPSIEDKIVKFPDRHEQHVFLEPEGRFSNIIYPNGISNSLPRSAQDAMVASIVGLEHARILQYGYAIEYECVDARELTHTLASQKVDNLYFAGQINGTTGYEEAAAQGFIAGANAALSLLGKKPLILSRQQAYIGVMIDDLVTKGTDEPYRMFTSRAERRLILRQDNARFRLTGVAATLGAINKEYLASTRAMELEVEMELQRLAKTPYENVTMLQLLTRPEYTYAKLPSGGYNAALSPETATQVEIRAKYAGYIAQEERAARKALEQESVLIPPGIDYHAIAALRYESREKLTAVRPTNLGQAARIPGVTPADVAVLSVVIKQSGTTGR